MRKLTHSEISRQRSPLDDASLHRRMLIFALLDNIRSLYNVGSIFRSSDGVRLGRLFLTGFTPFPPRKEIDKTALGATQTVPWSYYRDPLEPVAELKTAGVKICALEITDGGRPYYNVTAADFPLCLVVGNEITGVSKPLLDAADFAVEIPMVGHKQSLNVAVAYGIVLYDLFRVCRLQDSRPSQA
jgi:tRNA G18 (ribose-2'-O)-methylase SpoU